MEARRVTADDLRRLGTDFLQVPLDEPTISVVLERLVMAIDPEVAASASATARTWTRTCSGEYILEMAETSATRVS
eukprot:COSAG06_NODE_11606_length_1486_cov_2.108147_2_plen_76_part_00